MSVQSEKTDPTLRVAAAAESWASALDPKALRWLALLPEWTESLADSCGFPAGGEIKATIERAEEAMLCNVDRHLRLSGHETIRFWMPFAVRSWVFDDWEKKEAAVDLEDEVREISRRILLARSETGVSPAILCWAELAQAELSSTPVTGDHLSEHVRRSLSARDLASAGEWLFAGDWLSQPLGAPMEMATRRARREISLYHLREQDTTYLSRFLPRRDQLAELRAVADSKTQWGTHFIGLSGVGKTMLMRFVTSRHPGNPFKRASRIDFDRIDPRVPLEQPARLLQELGEGFAINFESGTQETLFKTFVEAVREAESARAGLGAHTPGWVAAMPEFDYVVTTFAAFLAEMPQPVALVLDTCEELAKLHPPGGQPWSVDATFDILERVHEAVGSIRVIVAGRRWVTAQYAELPREDPAPPEVTNAKDRDFLRFHEVRGFSEEEVREYLRNIRHLELDEEIVAAILASTRDPAAVPGYKEGNRAPADDFHSPNDLAFIANYLEEDRELGRKALEEGNFDSYVEKRILERAPEIQGAFPAATVLRHFDAATIEPVLGSDPETRRRLLARLIAEDWTHLEGGPETEKIVLKVDRGLLRRLDAFYARTSKRKRELEAARQTLQQHLAAKLDEAPAGATVELVDAAVRLLPPEQVVAKLESAAERAVALGAWDWADAVTQRLLSEDLEPPLDESLYATVTALYLATIRHSGGTTDGGQLWDAVAKMALAHPDKKRGAALRTRSGLAGLAERVAAAEAVDAEAAASLFWETCALLGKGEGKPVFSALLAAAEVMIDAREEQATAIPTSAIDACLERLLGELEGQAELQAYIAALRGRLQALDDNLEQAAAAFSQVALVRPGPVNPTPSFADWEAPASLVGRATLELLRFRLAMNEESEGLLERCEAIAERDGSADCAQLFSLVLQARLASGRLTDYQLEEAAEYEAKLEAYELTAPTHRPAPPLFVSVAQGWMAIGMTERGLKLLGARERLAASRRNDEDSIRAAALALLVGLRRLRLREGLALASHSVGSDNEMRTEALAAGVLIAGLQPSLNASRENDHAAWRARNLLEIQGPEALIPAPEDIEAPIDGDCGRLHHLLDVLESELIRQRWLRRRGETQLATQVRKQLSREMPRWSPRVSLCDPLGREQLRLEVRCEALLDDFNFHVDDHRLGQVAEIALEEGEVMALRVPERATGLLQLAANCFVTIDEPYGAFVATLRAALAEIHAGQYQGARQRQKKILIHYEELRLRHESLPALGVLTTWETGELIGSNNPWRGWVWRLTYYLDWCDGRSDGSRAAETAMEFGPEFALRPAHGALRPPGALRRGHRRLLRRRFPAVYRWLPAIPALALLVLLALGTTKLWAVLAAVLVCLGFAAVELVGPRLPRRVLPLSGFDLSLISEPSQERGPSVRANAFVAVRPRARFWLMRLYLRGLSRWPQSHFSVIPTGSYLTPKRRLPQRVQQALRPTLLGRQLPLKLEVDAVLAPIAWERILLSEQARKKNWKPLRSTDIWRVRPIGFPTLAPQWKSEDIVTVCSPSWRGFLASSAAAKLRWVADPSVLGTWPRRRPAIEDEVNSASRSRAAIALGTPVLTKGGWRLRLDEEELSAPLGDPSEPQLQQLVRPERLARRFSVVVVVGSPVGMSATPNGRLARGLRGLANEIFLSGAHAVIAVPVLPLPLASEAVDLLAGEIESWRVPPGDKQLRNLAAALRDYICKWAQLGGGEYSRQRQIELALDVCLFAPTEKGH